MSIKKEYCIRRIDKIESYLAEKIQKVSDGYIKHFGASDTKNISHLFFFKNPPWSKKEFLNIILDARTIIPYGT